MFIKIVLNDVFFGYYFYFLNLYIALLTAQFSRHITKPSLNHYLVGCNWFIWLAVISYYSPIPYGLIQGKNVVYHSVVSPQNDDSGNGWVFSYHPYRKGAWLVEFLHNDLNLKTLILDLADGEERLRSLLILSCLSFHVKENKIFRVDESKYAFEMKWLEKLILRMVNLLEKDELCILKNY
ncbi:uncharacterized protein LOC108484584 [Gossypium arboreum]|uniref:uncharacterized protein LOC108484584 n=1 Tax=Gossypium arboreum TaxID=29729 RepID=UPI0022F17CC1|nr:uncharacterized protein LOC108484584 [Gossypium arboreum]